VPLGVQAFPPLELELLDELALGPDELEFEGPPELELEAGAPELEVELEPGAPEREPELEAEGAPELDVPDADVALDAPWPEVEPAPPLFPMPSPDEQEARTAMTAGKTRCEQDLMADLLVRGEERRWRRAAQHVPSVRQHPIPPPIPKRFTEQCPGMEGWFFCVWLSTSYGAPMAKRSSGFLLAHGVERALTSISKRSFGEHIVVPW
jgi:hypothetical protein